VVMLRIAEAGARNESFGELRIEFEGAIASRLAAFQPFGILIAEFQRHSAEVGHTGMSECEMGIKLDGLLVHLESEIQAFAAGVTAATQEKVVGQRVFGGLLGDLFFFLGGEVDAKGLRDAAGNFILHLKDIGHFTVEALRPNGVAGLRFDELSGDAQAVARAAKAAAEHVGSAKFKANLGSGDGLVSIRKDGGAGEELQIFDVGQLGDDVFGHAVAKVFIFLGGTEIFKIEDGHRLGGWIGR